MSGTPATNPTSSPKGHKPKSLLARITSAQETGLVVVIALLMAILTAFSGTIPSPENIPVAQGQTVNETASALVVTDASGSTRSYAKADGWGLMQRGQVQTLQRKERLRFDKSAASGAVELPDAAGITIAGKTYLSNDGWSWSDDDDASKVLERDPRVNRFLNQSNLILVATVSAFIAIMAVGMTGIIVMGGIDLSIGSIYAISAVAGVLSLQGLFASGVTSPWVLVPVGLGISCAVGAACGLVNGSAIVGLKVHPFIITLGGMSVYRGLALVITKGQSQSPPEIFGSVIRTKLAGLNIVPASVMLIVGLIGAFVFVRTVFGRRVFAIGGNEIAAKYAGVPVGLTKIVMFTLGGLLAGLSAGLTMGYYGGADASTGNGYELNVIAAAVVGGASLSGGRGTALGAVLGAIIIQLIDNGFEMLKFDSNYRQIVIGLAIVLAVVVDQMKHRFASAKR